MKIEAGKSYRNGRGEKIDIKLDKFPFVDQNGNNYRIEGIFNSTKSYMDLVSEWTDPVVVECEWSDDEFLYPFGLDVRPKLQPFIGKKTKVTIEVIE